MVVGLAFAVAVGAAVYSTWSPCGQSMLSQLNPHAERTRAQRYGVTAVWYLVGSLVGAATLGVGVALLALAIDELSLDAATATGLAAVVALAGAALDARLAPWAPPFIRRQVNEHWLPRYRGWVYGFGFGWQVGTGVTTYVMTTAVFAMVALTALSGSVAVAFGVTGTFGLVRGLAVLSVRRVTTFEALAAFHRRFDALGPAVRRAVIALLVVVGVVAASDAWGWAGGLGAVAATGLGAAIGLRSTRASRRDAPTRADLRGVPAS